MTDKIIDIIKTYAVWILAPLTVLYGAELLILCLKIIQTLAVISVLFVVLSFLAGMYFEITSRLNKVKVNIPTKITKYIRPFAWGCELITWTLDEKGEG